MLDMLLFLASVAVISLSGVLMPGPLFAATMAQGYHDPNAGLRITLGHAIVEVPLIILVFLGFDAIFSQQWVFVIIGLVGGIILLWMGQDMIRYRKTILKVEEGPKRTALQDGVFTTLSNPYWILWWATVGAALIASATSYGLIVLPFFIIVHIGCDAGWSWLLTNLVNRSKGLWDVKWHHMLILVCGGIMVFFGLYFLWSSLQTLV
ncbi:MAG: LysE type translocator [Methanomassiliicoccales archaeon PtaU1.Bin124]|nr:MAG: LysE type translocator [Methanomassiliicoccales archaeon PtaU1.Bin124]